MKFLDPKEEVINIQMTPHGRRLLSRGKFKPFYYVFHDDDILYDYKCGGSSVAENQYDTESRIQEKTPRLAAQAGYSSAEKMGLRDEFAKTVERDFILPSHLGTSGLLYDKAPAWDLQSLNGEFSASVEYMSSSYQTVKIPQIDVDLIYKTSYTSNLTDRAPIEEDRVLSSRDFSDGSRVIVQPDHFLLNVLEKNTDFAKDNFDIEVFLVETETDPRVSGGTLDVLKPLRFNRPEVLVRDGILLDEPEEALEIHNPNVVQYYFDIFVDHEIDPAFVCQSVENLKTQDIYLDFDLSDLECEDYMSEASTFSTNIYNILTSTPDVCAEAIPDAPETSE